MRGVAKLGVVLLAFFAIFISLSIVSALTNSCPGGENQTILSLSDKLNAHGALWNDSNYQYKICYDQIFGVNFSGSFPHACGDGNSNGVLRLSDITNAHAQNISKTSYPIRICHAGVNSCVVVTSDCPVGKSFIVSLSDNDNAHLSANQSYPSRICCSSANAIVPISTGGLISYFTNSTGSKITNSYVNNSVNIVVETALTTGTAKIEIYEDDGSYASQSIRAGTNAINVPIGSDGKARYSWEITDTDIANGDAHDDYVPLISDSDLEFYLNVSVAGISNVSGILKTSRSEGTHYAPNAVIGSPVSESIYFVGNTVNFSQASYGERAFTLNWDVDDSSLDVLKKNLSEFSHVYLTPGVKKITLTATDRSGLSGSSSMNIVVLSTLPGVQVIPIIERPGVNSKVSSNLISYNASHSYVLNITSSYNISCLGGMCPSLTTNCPSGFLGVCPIEIKNELGLRNNYGSLGFNWTFVESTGNSSEYGLAKMSGMKQYGSTGQKQIGLNLTLSNFSAFTFNPFEITGVVDVTSGCSSDGRWWTENGIRYNTSAGYCGGFDYKSGGLKDCCPTGTICTSAGLFGGIKCSSDQCIQYATKSNQDYYIRLCDDYNYIQGDNATKEFQCNSDCNLAATSSAQISALSAGLGSSVSLDSVVCTWSDKQCSAAKYTRQTTSSTTGGTVSEYQCIMEVTGESTCDRNEKTVDYVFKRANKYGGVWKVEADTDSKCAEKGTVKLRCGGSLIVLPVFDSYNLITSLLGILLVYAFVAFRKANKKRE